MPKANSATMANLCRFHLSDFVSTWGFLVIEQRVEGGCQNSGAYHAARWQAFVRCDVNHHSIKISSCSRCRWFDPPVGTSACVGDGASNSLRGSSRATGLGIAPHGVRLFLGSRVLVGELRLMRSSPPRSFVQAYNCFSRLPEKLRQGASFRLSLFRMKPGRRRPPTTSSMKPANGPAPHRGSHARLLRPLRGCRAPRRLLEGILPLLPFHEDCPVLSEPLPPCATLPTIACPPSFTVTCSTRTVCSPALRYRLSASTCEAKVRASLL